MSAVLRPRLVSIAALVVIALGAIGVFAGAGRAGPMGLLLGELLAIYAIILWATPTIPPLRSRSDAVALAAAEAPFERRGRIARVYDIPEAEPASADTSLD